MTRNDSTTTTRRAGRTRIRTLASALVAVGTAFSVCGVSVCALGATTAHAQVLAPDASPAFPSFSTSSSMTPTPAARAAGITGAGTAYMGWSSHVAGRGGASAAAPMTTGAVTPGIDVSSYQGNVDWASYWSQGKKFAYVKATENTNYTNPYFSEQYSGSSNVGMTRGSYHFATPNTTSGATQANYFVDHGGGWSADGRTLPGALDIEYNPYGATCYGLSQTSMVSWISSFLGTYHSRTGRYPVIYSTFDWWSTCTGNSSAFASLSPFWIARYSSSVGSLPAGTAYYTFWQYSSSPIDQNYFNGDLSRLHALATG